MHELAIAGAALTVVEDHAQGRRVAAVHVRIGHLRQVVPDALAFSWEVASAGTVAEGSELVVESVPAAGVCRACGAHTEWEAFPLACAACGGLDVEVTAGEELSVESLEIEEVEGSEAVA